MYKTNQVLVFVKANSYNIQPLVVYYDILNTRKVFDKLF